MDHRHPVTRHYCIFELLHEGNVGHCIWVRSDYFLKSVMKAVMSSHFYKIRDFDVGKIRHCSGQHHPPLHVWMVEGTASRSFWYLFDWFFCVILHSGTFSGREIYRRLLFLIGTFRFADLRCTEICQRHLFTAETCIATFLNQKQRIQYSRFYAGQ